VGRAILPAAGFQPAQVCETQRPSRALSEDPSLALEDRPRGPGGPPYLAWQPHWHLFSAHLQAPLGQPQEQVLQPQLQFTVFVVDFVFVIFVSPRSATCAS